MSRRYNGLDFNRKPKKIINSSHLRELVSWLFWIVISAILAFVLMFVFGLRTNVIGNSMEPNLFAGEEILIDRMIYNISEPDRKDIIVFQPNGNLDSHYYVKRVIGLPGETLQIIDGYVYIDGVLYDEEGAYDKIADPGLLVNEITLSEDEFIVLGDNRNFSEDSRSGNIGVVKKSYIIGKAWFKVTGNLEKLGFVR